MKVFELRSMISKMDPNAEVLVTTADIGNDGCFGMPVDATVERTVMGADRKSHQVMVLHHRGPGNQRVWAAKTQPVVSSTKVWLWVKARDLSDHRDEGLIVARGGYDGNLEDGWMDGHVSVVAIGFEIPEGWAPVVFDHPALANEFTAAMGYVIERTVSAAGTRVLA